MQAVVDDVVGRIARELGLGPGQVARTVALLDEGNTIPFLARYRKEVTGGLDEVVLAALSDRLLYLRALEERRVHILATIGEAGKLTPELEGRLRDAATLQELEDLYLPYKPRRRTRATIARERGLAPLADLLLAQPASARLARDGLATPYLNEDLGVLSVDDAYAGARDIVAETVAEDADVRASARDLYRREGAVGARLADAAKDPAGKYALYYQFTAPVAGMAPHRTLALNRAEREGVLRVAVDVAEERVVALAQGRYPARPECALAPDLRLAVQDGVARLLMPALEREVRSALTEAAEAHAIGVFAANLRSLLLQPPLRGRVVLGIDPGFRTGCKVAVVDPTGKYLEGGTIFPHPPQGRWAESKAALAETIRRHGVTVLAIGNGTASRETESLVAETLRELRGQKGISPDLAYAIVDEAGASVYSASEVARHEFPDLDATQRGNVSIARRLQDPLAELVKIDPRSVGVGLYQHDVDQKELGRTLERVVVLAVNYAGVDVNTASASLLQHVAGVNRRVAENIVRHRDQHGPFRSRAEFKKVLGLGAATFQQAAGFLRVPAGANPLDNTFIHPESYAACALLIERLPEGPPEERLAARAARLHTQLKGQPPLAHRLAGEVGVGVPTLLDIVENLARPGVDPREALPKPILRSDVLSLDDLREGMTLKGTVRNVVDFGAFVDIGLKHDGLVHVSQLGGRFVRHPLDVVSVGDVVQVRVLSVDRERGRIALSMRDV